MLPEMSSEAVVTEGGEVVCFAVSGEKMMAVGSCEQPRDSRWDFLAGELELVLVQVVGGGRAPEKVTNVGAAGGQRAAARPKSYGSCLRLCQRHLRRTSIMRK